MNASLVLCRENGSQKSFPLPSNSTVIGRRRDCDLRIPLVSVSRRHCQINCYQGVLKLRDLGSRNGTHLNGEAVDEAVIQGGDHIQVGPLTFVLQVDGQPERVAQPNSAAPRHHTPAKDVTDTEAGTFAELDESDSVGETAAD
jgi:pSer/pThr/pTyr-binding forkhead associated (FHA) protein